jgi:hypothetical protein
VNAAERTYHRVLSEGLRKGLAPEHARTLAYREVIGGAARRAAEPKPGSG